MHRIHRVVLAAVRIGVTVMAAASCASAPVSNQSVMTQLDRAMKHYATLLRGAPADSVAAAYAENGALVLPGMKPLQGRAAIRDFLAPMVGTVVVSSVTIKTERQKVSVTDGFSSEGTYTQVAAPKGEPPRKYTGGFYAHWLKSSDNRWLLLRLEMYPDPPKPN